MTNMTDHSYSDAEAAARTEATLKRMLRTPHTNHEPTTPLGKRRRAQKEAEKG